MKELPTRKNIRLSGHDYSSNGIYFVTVCVKEQHELLGNVVVGDAVHSVPPHVALNNTGKIVEVYLSKMNDILEWATLAHSVIMPNHVHLLIVLRERNGTLRASFYNVQHAEPIGTTGLTYS